MEIKDYYPPTWEELESAHIIKNGQVNAAQLKRVLDTMVIEHPLRNLQIPQANGINYTEAEYLELFVMKTDKTIEDLKKSISTYLKALGKKRFGVEEDFKQHLFRCLQGDNFDVKKEVDIHPFKNKNERENLRADIIVHVNDEFVPIELKYNNTEQACRDDVTKTEKYVRSYKDISHCMCIFAYSKTCDKKFDARNFDLERTSSPKPYPFSWKETNNMQNTQQGEMAYYYAVIDVVEDNIFVKKYPHAISFFRDWAKKQYE